MPTTQTANQSVNDAVIHNTLVLIATQRTNKRQLARKTGIEYRALRRRLDGEVQFSATEVALIADAFNVAPGDLFQSRARAVAS